MKTSPASRLGPAGRLLYALLLCACSPAPAQTFVAGGIEYDQTTATEWKLPGRLREVSGFTIDADDRLFAHDDEVAVIHELDYTRGAIVRSFALGDPPLRGDFEGITHMDGYLVLTTSSGDLYLARPGKDGERVAYRVIRTGLGRRCEIEGVEYVADQSLLYFACKTAREPGLDGTLTLLAWSPATRAEVAARTIRIPQGAFADPPGKGPVRPSGLARSPRDGSLVLTAAGHRALVTLSPAGDLVGAVRVPDSRSLPQLEAIAFTGAGTLILGSEGGNDRGRMRVYQPAD